MAFRGIPDAERNRHPYLAWLFELGFDFTVISCYRRETQFLPGYQLPPGTIIISNHQRDADVPILGTALCQRRGLRLQWPLPYFAAREDLFRRGFLSEYVAGWPPPVPQLLGQIPLRWFFEILRTKPIRRVREFSFTETLEAAQAAGLGMAGPNAIFNTRGQRELAAAFGILPPRVSTIPLRSKQRSLTPIWGLRRLRSAPLRKLDPAFRATVAGQLREFAALLDAGHSVYFSPEGVISASGKFGRVRDGLRQLCRLAATPPPLLPVALSYDGLGSGRLRVIMQVGELLPPPDTADAAGFSAAMRRAILELIVVNPSHLLAAYLRIGPLQFSTQELKDWLRRARAALTAGGLKIDVRLETHTLDKLVTKRLRWLEHKRLVRCEHGHWRNLWPRDTPAGWQSPANQVTYFANAFEDLVPGFARTLAA